MLHATVTVLLLRVTEQSARVEERVATLPTADERASEDVQELRQSFQSVDVITQQRRLSNTTSAYAQACVG